MQSAPLQRVYVTASAQCLPGPPIGNAEMADYIGHISPEADRRGRLTLRQNRIQTRHYAIRPDGSTDWTVAKLAGRAVRNLLAEAEVDRGRIGYLATATTQNDLMVPGLASLTHAEAGLPPMEVASLQSVCASSMMAMKSATLQVGAGEHQAAIAVGAEFSSRYFRPENYHGTSTMAADGTLAGDAEFLRWTLSDGAAGMLLENRPAAHGMSLRVDWIALTSYADRFGPCMTGGGIRQADGTLTPWSLSGGPADAARAGAFQLRQDVHALYRMLPVWLGEFMRLVDAGRIEPEKIDHFLCHFSAHSLREEMVRLAEQAGCMIPQERWFTNLYEKGNVGAASIYLMLDDLLRSGRLKHGQKLLLAVPESGQCIISHAALTVVEA